MNARSDSSKAATGQLRKKALRFDTRRSDEIARPPQETPRQCRIKSPLNLALALLAGAGLVHTASAALTVESAGEPAEWRLRFDGKPVLTYAFTPTKFKPYVKELCTIRGENILRDSPHDHLHHHGLMYAVAVNGLNFWEETSGNGVEKPVQSPQPEISTSPDGLPRATIRQTIHWLTPQDAFLPDSPKNALLIEQRTLVLTVNKSKDEVALHWKSQFEVGGKTNTVILAGASYFGLGARFLQELDPIADHFNSDGKPDLTDRQDVSPHDWYAVAFDQPAAPATLAMFGHPSNTRGNATFFTMKRPFAYVSATQALDKEPLVYHCGDRWQVSYLVTLYPELKSREALNERSLKWNNSKP